MLKLFANVTVLSGVFTLLASLQVLSNEGATNDHALSQNTMEAELVSGRMIAVYGGRVTRLVPTAPDIAAIRILDQPTHGHASVNPDNTITLVMTRSDHVGALDLRYELLHADGTTSEHVTNFEVVPGAQESGWGTSENHYMLATDAEDRVIVEPGDNHRKIYISETGLTKSDIAALEGSSSAKFIADSTYGTTEGADPAT